MKISSRQANNKATDTLRDRSKYATGSLPEPNWVAIGHDSYFEIPVEGDSKVVFKPGYWIAIHDRDGQPCEFKTLDGFLRHLGESATDSDAEDKDIVRIPLLTAMRLTFSEG